MRRAFGWRVNRLSDRPTGLEIVGSGCGYAISLLFLAGGAYLLLGGIPSPAIVVGAFVGGILFLGLSSLSTGHFLYRAWLRRRLATTGLATTATVIDRWRLPSDGGAWSCIRFRFNAAGDPVEAVACDSTELVRRIAIGSILRLRYDPDDPRLLLIDGVG
ncbi:MAG TPA: hypothetical protein VGR85_07180 [Candidatus Limnocylindria bacterium]|jgi:hypothetical protein|nr:hypothetical protein [Candidatus Limnocylindria bacterium]